MRRRRDMRRTASCLAVFWGSFLEALCYKTGATGIGFDPGAPKARKENLFEIRQNKFKGIGVEGYPYNMVILRHVMEHISKPKQFLSDLLADGTLAPNGSLIIEVPDLDWILENQSIFDITYEHCGYFTRDALQTLLHEIGFKELRFNKPFGGQYLLVEAKLSKFI